MITCKSAIEGVPLRVQNTGRYRSIRVAVFGWRPSLSRSERLVVPGDARKAKGALSRVTGAQTLERGLELLSRIVEEPVRMVDLTRESDLGKATVWRLVNTLSNQGLVSVNDRGELQGGVRLLHMASLTQSRMDLVVVAQPWIDALALKTGITAFMGRREGDSSVHLYRSASTQRLMVSTPPGTRRRLVETSLGKALLLDEPREELSHAAIAGGLDTSEFFTAMDENRVRGFVLNEGGPPEFINAIAAPVRNSSGAIIAAISVASPAQYLSTSEMPIMGPTVLDTANLISKALGWNGWLHPR